MLICSQPCLAVFTLICFIVFLQTRVETEMPLSFAKIPSSSFCQYEVSHDLSGFLHVSPVGGLTMLN